ncbi:SubName: Full=Uncharacterized protein {ECO:0000313/EMBL:CCA75491.1} [Serendipita indica DSM 11827]|nr:SubName: Full=Uncharacterized protein {ECO:0000313/EMBL:CCA75491.1} [Serendipita indica DSM 11827]
MIKLGRNKSAPNPGSRMSKLLPGPTSLQPAEKPLSHAQDLPPEILELIFGYLEVPESRFRRIQQMMGDRMIFFSLVFICRQWHGPAIVRLYASIHLNTNEQAIRLYETLRQRSHLRPLIRALHLPYPQKGPATPHIFALYCRILALVSDLEDLSVPIKLFTPRNHANRSDRNGTIVTLPITPNRHQTIEALTVYGGVYLGSIPFPRSFTIFTNLRYLNLEGFALNRHVDPRITPPLPHLEKIVLTRFNGLEHLDDWLLASPKLTTIGLWYTQPTATLPKVLCVGRIECLEMLIELGINPLPATIPCVSWIFGCIFCATYGYPAISSELL